MGKTLLENKKIATLCEACSKIPFNGLLLPFVSEIDDLQNGQTRQSSGFFDMDRDRGNCLVDVGKMSRILRNSAACDFCAAVSEILRNHRTSPCYHLLGHELPAAIDYDCFIRITPGFTVLHPHRTEQTRWIGRLCVTWTDDDRQAQGAYSCFQTSCYGKASSDQRTATAIPLASRLLAAGRPRPLDIDMSLIWKWMNTCSCHHTQSCGRTLRLRSDSTPSIRLLDVERMCVVDGIDLNDAIEGEYKYIALSYVSGKVRHPSMLTTKTFDAYQRPGSITLKDLATTIADFIRLARALAVRHVWVDALCIIQDDREDRQVQVTSMHAIYQDAFLTVIAAAGHDLNAGLPGVRPSTRKRAQRELTVRLPAFASQNKPYDCITMLSTLSHPEHTAWTPLTSAPWSSRGWTFQERMLSRRVLIFTEEQVFWSCSKASFSEESQMEFDQSQIKLPDQRINSVHSSIFTTLPGLEMAPIEQDVLWNAYKSYVQTYSKRDLSYEGDIHSAFAGMMQAITSVTQETFLFGLPRSRLNYSLSWTNYSSIRRRVAPSDLPMTNKNVRIKFPSWAWMGWVGEVDVNALEERVSGSHTPAVQLYLHHTSPLRITPVTEMPRLQPQEAPNASPISKSMVSIGDIKAQYPRLSEQVLDEIPDETVLFFWTDTRKFRVQHPTAQQIANYNDRSSAYKQDYFKPRVLDKDGKQVGELEMIEPGISDTESQEFVALGSVRIPDEVQAIVDSEPMMIVMQIGYRCVDGVGTGLIKERLNIGTVSESVWRASELTRTLVALQ